MQQPQPRKIEQNEVFEFEFSLCTLVTDSVEYEQMRESFIKGGFTTDICEYLYIDNIGKNTFEAYAGLNRFLREAKGKYIILCHQDILLLLDGIKDLRARIDGIEKTDARWAVLGNAGSINIKYRGLHIQGPGKEWNEELLPLRAQTLDENFIVVKNSANLALSADLEGFHLYGADICFVADVLGYNSYVIDFKLHHKSYGNDDESFYRIKRKFIKKYGRAFRSRFAGTTITRFYVSGNSFRRAIGNTKLVLFFARQYYKLFRPKKLYHTKLKGNK
jgi:hypothetical protein